jgi:hypothetical protein
MRSGDAAHPVSTPNITMTDNAAANPLRFTLLEIRFMITNLAIVCEPRAGSAR